MPLRVSVHVVILLGLFAQHIEGVEKVVAASDAHGGLFSDDDDDDTFVVAVGNASNISGSLLCCMLEGCSCPSLHHALTTNVTSNVLINITNDVKLDTIIQLVNITNISIIGYNNPSVKCNNSGGLQFISCYNCTIKGIAFERCGARNISNHEYTHAVLQFNNSSDIAIKNCLFQQSAGQAVVLSGVSGDVTMNHCNFIFNKQYGGHGVAVHYIYTSSYSYPAIPTVTIINCNFSANGGAESILYFAQLSMKQGCLHLQNCNFYHNKGVPIYLSNQNLYITGHIKFYRNVAENGAGIFLSDYSNVVFYKNAKVCFRNNTAHNKGGAIFLTNTSSIVFNSTDSQKAVTEIRFDGNNAKFGGAIYAYEYSNVIFGEGVAVAFHENIATSNNLNDDGGAVYIFHNSNIMFKGNCMVTFSYNSADHGEGGAIYVLLNSTVTFLENSSVTFNNNRARSGGAIYVYDYTFAAEDNNNNLETSHQHIASSNVTFLGNTTVIFNNNVADYGGAMYIEEFCYIRFTENSIVEFNHNKANTNGGAVYIDQHPITIFDGKSITVFVNNYADGQGGAMYIDFSIVIVKRNSTVTLNSNEAKDGGALYTYFYSDITFQENCALTLNNNEATTGGAIYIEYMSIFTFKGNSTVTLNNNGADIHGGAVYVNYKSTITFQENSTIIFNHNKANINGGAVYIYFYSAVTLAEGSKTIFNKNNANNSGGAICTGHYSKFTFQDNSVVTFIHNKAFNGGTAYFYDRSCVTVQGESTVIFNDNSAAQGGGVLYCYEKCEVLFKENSTATFIHNKALQGGVMYSRLNSKIMFEENCAIKFIDNKALEFGGAINSFTDTVVVFRDYAKIKFEGNNAINGGSVYSFNAFIILTGNTNISFTNNSADKGGTMCTVSSNITFAENSVTEFTSNIALQDGGALYLSDHTNFSFINYAIVSFYDNIASDYGGAIYIQFSLGTITLNASNIYFAINDINTKENSVYINVPKSCDSNCLLQAIKGVNTSRTNLTQILPVNTSPRKLALYNPAKCINDKGVFCDTYYIENIMLGQEIRFDACVLDYYDQPVKAGEFMVIGMNHKDYSIYGSKYILITCNHTTHGITVIGNLNQNVVYNYSMNISLYVVRISESKTISVNLTVELRKCHPGFWYFNESQKCECYSTMNIVSCSGSNSTIKRGYWFGTVEGKPTVTFCPNNYCNFTCCEITNGIYHLSPVRASQCTSHRSGVACGSCEIGYTLSFDSAQCVEVNKCTVGQSILVVGLSVVYWIAIVLAVFTMMYFEVSIGSLYAIVYYYSIVDILISSDYFVSRQLYTIVSIMSSFSKLTPQFLGQLCLIKHMSGIDQQFIHYVYPAVILFILIMISKLARKSRKISEASFFSRSVIHFICFLLLLSYTSVATTSLLLMRPLKFVDVHKIYSYLSPDIEYCHNRHLAYVIVAIIFTLVVVVGLPLLLLLEPFLNSKVNFVKIKPLLDQFQGCYKDKYRWFAGYYLICRIVIILLIIVRISDDFTNEYLLVSACALMELIHLTMMPYVSAFQNMFDGIILHIIVMVSMLSIVKFSDNANTTFLLILAYLLITLPILSYITIKLFLNKNKIKNATKHVIKSCFTKCSPNYNRLLTDGVEESESMNEIGIIVDDNTRRNATVVAINRCDRSGDIMWCREPFLEDLNDIEDLKDIIN